MMDFIRSIAETMFGSSTKYVLNVPKGTTDELMKKFAKTGGCVDCGCIAFREGPSGGLSTNYKCDECGAKFNIAIVNGTVLQFARI